MSNGESAPRSIRTTPWWRISQLIVGLALFGFGISFILRSTLGAAPWDVLATGITNHIPQISFGMITIILSGVVLLLWIPLRQKPGLGTVLNAVLIGPFADLGLAFLPAPEALWLRILFLAFGLVLVGMGSGLYIGANLGPGPRDGLMTGLHAKTGWAIWKVRTGIEVTVVVLGAILGGIVGWGTLAFALFIGPLVQFFLRLFTVPLAQSSAAPPSH